MILAGDVGATKILLEAGEFSSGQWRPVLARRYLLAEFANFSDAIEAFLGELPAEGRARRSRISAAAVGVAGAVRNNKVVMTHRAWKIDGDAVGRRHGIARFAVVNDLAAAAHGVDALDRKDFVTIQPGKANPTAPRVVLGVGTGLGIAYLLPKPGTDPQFDAPRRGEARRPGEGRGPISSDARRPGEGRGPISPSPRPSPKGEGGKRPSPRPSPEGEGERRRGGVVVIPGEGGHMGFSPTSAEQAELCRAMMATRPRVEAEEICSGMGISNIYEFMRRRGDCPAGAPERADAAWVSQSAAERGDAACIATLDLFAECLGNVAGDHTLAVMARGGVILAGGVVAKLAPSFNQERFRAAFCAKGHFASELMRIPVKLARNERIALIGAAHVAIGL